MMDSHEAIGKKAITIIDNCPTIFYSGREFMTKSVTADKIAEFIHQGIVLYTCNCRLFI